MKKKSIEIKTKSRFDNEKEATEVAHALQTAPHMFTHIRFDLNASDEPKWLWTPESESCRMGWKNLCRTEFMILNCVKFLLFFLLLQMVDLKGKPNGCGWIIIITIVMIIQIVKITLISGKYEKNTLTVENYLNSYIIVDNIYNFQ